MVKESHFFFENFDKGIDWYRGLFPDVEGKLAGEVDSNLMNSSVLAADYISQVCPDAKLIAIFRNPATLYYSSYLYALKEGEVEGSPRWVWENQPHFRREVSYQSRVQPFLDRFPREQLLVLKHEEIRADGVAALDRIFSFLGLEPNYDRELLTKEVNVSRTSRAPWVTLPIIKTVHFLRSRRFHRIVAAGKSLGLNTVLESFMRAESSTELPPDLSVEIFEFLRDELGELQRSLGIAWTL